MKKVIILLLTNGMFLFACKKDTAIEASNGLKKTVHYKIFTSKDYSGTQYDNYKAGLNIKVTRNQLSSLEKTTVWDTVINLQSIRNYPSQSNPLIIEKEFTNVNDKTEIINISYTKNYDNNGQTHTDVSEPLSSGQSTREYLIGM
jgi:hypothetical protein